MSESVERPVAAWRKDKLTAFGNGIGDDGAPGCFVGVVPEREGAKVTYLRSPDGAIERGERMPEGVEAVQKTGDRNGKNLQR